MTAAGRIFLETHVAPLLMKERTVHQVAIDLRCDDGSRRPVLTSWQQVEVDSQVVGCRIMFVDASDRRAYERDLLSARMHAEEVAALLQKSEARLRELNLTLEQQVAERTAERDRVWQNSHDLIVVVDRRWRMKAVNPAVTALLGYPPFDVIGKRFDAFVHADDLAAVSSSIRQAATARVSDFEARLRAVDGAWRHFAWSAAPGEGEAYVIGRDVTVERLRQVELEAAQDALRQSQKLEAMGSLTGGVAHDFNNLLTPITGALDMLQRRGLRDDRERRLVEGGLHAAERARVLVQRLLAFARRQPLQPVPIDMASVVLGMADLIESTIGPQIRLNVEVEPELPAAVADANQIEMALLNLAVNARDAMPDGGTLRIAAQLADVAAGHRSSLASGRYIRLSVADTGIGMDEETLARAVDPFFSTKGVGKGTGLGLSMAHGLAAQLGGALTISSKPFVGTSIELYLPSTSGSTEKGNAAICDEIVTAPGVALLVEDEDLVRTSTAAMLVDIGFRVVEATSAEDALSQIEQGVTFDLVITDHLMPGKSGTDLARRVREIYPGIPILVVSGYVDADKIAPDLPRLTKPFRRDELEARLASLQ